MPLSLHSSAFEQGGSIPQQYTCQGDDISPPLSWQGIPDNCQSLLLIVDDPDAPDPRAPKMTWVHWLLYNIPADCGGLHEAMRATDLPEGTLQGLNDWKRTGYGGPCPPIGRHRYFFKLYALNCRLADLDQPTKPILEAAIQGHIIDQAELIASFGQ